MVPIHIDTATEEELITLPGVGGPSAKNIIRYLKTHKTFTKLVDLQSCAPHINVAQFHLLHIEGTWTSAIQDLASYADGPKADPTVTVDETKDNTDVTLEASGVTTKTPLQGTTPGSELDQGEIIEPDKAPLQNVASSSTDDRALQELMKSLMNTFNNFMHHQTTTNLNHNNRLIAVESEVNTVTSTLKQVTDQFDQLRLEVRAGSAISSHYKKGTTPPTSFLAPQSVKTDSKRSLIPNKTPDLGTRPKYGDMPGYTDSGANNVSTSGYATRQSLDRDNLPDTRHAKLLDKFDGKVGSWENWFHKFELTAEMCKWTDASKLFMLTNALTKSALTAHRNLPKSSCSDYQALVDALQERFGKTDSATKAVLRSELYCIKQMEGEELEEFADRVYSLTMDAHPPETTPAQLQLYAVESFLQGCKDSNSAWLTTTVKNPATITEAVNQMKLAQSSSRRMKMKLAVRSLATPDEDPLGLVNFEPEVRRMEAGSDKCYKCGGKWHFARDCPNENCKSCGGSGHTQSACPVRQSQASKQSSGHRRNRYHKDRNNQAKNTKGSSSEEDAVKASSTNRTRDSHRSKGKGIESNRRDVKIRKVSCEEQGSSSESASDLN